MAKSAKPLSRTVRFLLIGFMVVCMTLSVGIAALRFQPGLIILPFAAKVSKSPYCTVWKGVTDVNVKLTQADLEQRIIASSHLVRKDNEYKLWSTRDENTGFLTRAILF
jgi:hypothetical protein